MKDLLKGRFKFSSENIIAVLMFAFVMIFPAFVSAYKVQVYTNFFNSILLCMSIVLIWGYCGTFSFGQAAFYGLGAYIYGMISGNVENHALTPLILLVSVDLRHVISEKAASLSVFPYRKKRIACL